MGEDRMWFYMDSTGQEFGPYPSSTMKGWFQQGFFPMQGELQVRLDDMSPDQHFYIKDLYPGPIMERAFDGEPNLPSGGRGGRNNRGGGRNPAAALSLDAASSPYADPSLQALWGMQGMPGMPGMPGMMPGAGGMPPFGGGFPAMPGMRPGMMPGMNPLAGMPMLPGPGASTGRFQGRIKSFNVQKGFGFIECPEAHQIYGRDVFLHKAQIANFQIGSQLSFGVEMNKNNMPQARDLIESDLPGLGGFAGGGMGGMGFSGGGMGGGGGKGGYNNQKGGGGGKGKGGGGKNNKSKGGNKDNKPKGGDGEKKKGGGGGGSKKAAEAAPAPAPKPE